MASGSGSTIGPGGALYVTEGATGKVLRVDPKTGEVSTFASGLPKSIIGIGGAMDIAFIGKTAYVLVTLVGNDVGGSDVDGIYRVDGPTVSPSSRTLANSPRRIRRTLISASRADSSTHWRRYRGGFLVTDGHHNRVLRVTLDGEVTELITFDNIVPTGLEVSGATVYMAEAGPVPHLAQDGKVVSFGRNSLTATEVSAGATLLVDVEFGRGHGLFALSQGTFLDGGDPGSPAAAEHWKPAEGQQRWHVQRPCGRVEPTNLARVHREHRVRRDPRRGDWEIDNVSGLSNGVSH